MKRLSAVSALAAVLALCFISPASAQIDNGLPGPQPFDMSGMILDSTMNRLRIESAMGAKAKKAKRGTTKTKPAPAAKADLSAPKYRASREVSLRTREKFLQLMEKQSPADGAKLRQLFTRFDPVEVWTGFTQPYGISTGDMADAFAAFWALNHAIAGGQSQVQPSQVMGLRNQMRSIFSRNPAVRKATAAQKQEVSEIWMIQYIVLRTAFSNADRNKDTALQQKLRKAAASRMQNELHLDVSKVSLTDKGLVTRS